jgi:hypothetical protein
MSRRRLRAHTTETGLKQIASRKAKTKLLMKKTNCIAEYEANSCSSFKNQFAYSVLFHVRNKSAGFMQLYFMLHKTIFLKPVSWECSPLSFMVEDSGLKKRSTEVASR